jgi:hypothetical protein
MVSTKFAYGKLVNRKRTRLHSLLPSGEEAFAQNYLAVFSQIAVYLNTPALILAASS